MHALHTMEGDVRAILSQDPFWAAYAIADLHPDLAHFCKWLLAPDASGLALLYTGLEPPILMTAGTLAGVAAAMSDVELPPELFLSVLPEHLPAVQLHYPHIDRQDMLRMSLPAEKHVPAPTHPTVPLSRRDEQRLQALYQHGGEFAPDAFSSSQLDDGFFFGIEDAAGALATAGGTHVAYRPDSPSSHHQADSRGQISDSMEGILTRGVAAIGNIYTRPDCRGLGYGMAVTASVVWALQADGYELIVLNVGEQNLIARSIYEKLGLILHCKFFEGFASRSQEAVALE